jgi:hypothetical protein
MSCYEGLDGTEGVGLCKGGTCDDQGVCQGQVLPKVQACDATGTDQSCDGFSGCIGAFRWAIPLPGLASPGALAAGADGTIAAASASPSGAVLSTFDARGRRCWGAPAALGNAALKPRSAALSGSKLASDGSPTQIRCLNASGVVASTIVGGDLTGTAVLGDDPTMHPSLGGQDAFVTVTDASGKTKGIAFGGAGNELFGGVAVGPAGEIYVTGTTDMGVPPCGAAADGGASGAGTWIMKLAPDLSCVWSRAWLGTMGAGKVAVLASGKIVVAGTFSGTVDFGAGPVAAPMDGSVFVAELDDTGKLAGAPAVIKVDQQGPLSLAVSSDRIFVGGGYKLGLTLGGQIVCPALGSSNMAGYFVRLDAGTLKDDDHRCFRAGQGDLGLVDLAVDAAASVTPVFAGSGNNVQPLSGGSFSVGNKGVTALKLNASYTDRLWVRSFAGTSVDAAVDGVGNVVLMSYGAGVVDLVAASFDLGAGGAFLVQGAP